MNEETFYRKYEFIRNGKKHYIWAFDDFSTLFNGSREYAFIKPIYYRGNLLPLCAKGYQRYKELEDGMYVNMLYQEINGHTIIKSSSSIKRTFMDVLELSSKDILTHPVQKIVSLPYYPIEDKYLCGLSVPRCALDFYRQKNTEVNEVTLRISRFFEFDFANLGLTGSLALGARNYNDIDIVFYGSAAEIYRLFNNISFYNKKYGSVIENGLKWPCRFYFQNKIVCCFFNYINEDYLNFIFDKNATIIRQNVVFDVTVEEDIYGLSKTPFLKLKGTDYSFIWILGRAFRGVFKSGDRIQGVGDIISVSKQKIIMCRSPFINIINWKRYFNR